MHTANNPAATMAKAILIILSFTFIPAAKLQKYFGFSLDFY